MTRTTSAAFRAAAFAQETGEVVVTLLTIMHDSLADPIRLSNDPTQRVDGTGASQPAYGTVSRGDTYLFCPFQLLLPDDQDRTSPAARLRLSNVHQDLIPLLRSVDTPASVLVEVVLASAPDDVEVSFPPLDLSEATFDAAEIEVDLVMDTLENEPYPAESFDPSGFPALFG